MGEEKLPRWSRKASPRCDAHRSGESLGLTRVIVDTTMQPRPSPSRPTPSSCTGRAERLVKLAKKTGVPLRQSYERVGKYALIAHQRYAHAKQFKRANRSLRTIRTYLRPGVGAI